MPYVSRAERERADWRTLPEVVAHIVRVDPCQPEDAPRQLGNALAHGVLWPLRWEDTLGLPSGPNPATMPLDLPQAKWSKAEIDEIDWGDGTAIDRSEFSPRGGRRRRLLIHRLAIRQWWPAAPAVAKEAGGQVIVDTAPAKPEPPSTPAPSKAQTPGGKKQPIPNSQLVQFMKKIKTKGGPIPAADGLVSEVVAYFPNYHVTRSDVRMVHRQVWGELSPGPRRKSAR